MEIGANLNYLRISPRKVRLVANLVKGLDVRRAELELHHLPKRSAGPLLKLIRSAAANAKQNFQVSGDGLYIKSIIVNPGPVLERFRARAFGRAAPIRKRTSHILLVLDTRGAIPSRTKEKQKRKVPVAREVKVEDLRSKMGVRPKATKPTGEPIFKPKTPGFVRRIFRRKAI